MHKMGVCQNYSSKSNNESKKTKGKGRSGSVPDSKKYNINYYSSRRKSGSDQSAYKKENGRPNIPNMNSSLKYQQQGKQGKQVNPSHNQNITSINSQQSNQVIASKNNYNLSNYSQQSNFVESHQNVHNQNLNIQYNQGNYFQNQNILSNNNVYQSNQVNQYANQNIVSNNVINRSNNREMINESNLNWGNIINNSSSNGENMNIYDSYNQSNFQGYNNNNNHIFNIDYYSDQNYNNKSNNEYTSGGYSSNNDFYQRSYDRNDNSSEENTDNYRKNQIYCGVKGLSNNGNNCFINSTIQCLKHCFIFTKYIINSGVSSNGAFGQFKKLIENMCNKKSYNLNALSLKNTMSKYNQIYSDCEQHDSTIFFNDLLNALNSELCEETSFYEGDDDDDELFQVKYEKCMTKSKVNEYFSFFIKEMTVFNCGEEMINYEEYYYLDLPILDEYNRKISSLDEALQKYTKKSYDYGKNSFICCKHQKQERSNNQNLFASLPEILVISLKRVVNGIHLNHYFDYQEHIDMRKYINNYNKSTRYELFGEILHYGSAYGGHKIAICKNFNTNNWYIFNDSSVTAAHENDIFSSNAFLLFYKRI